MPASPLRAAMLACRLLVAATALALAGCAVTPQGVKATAVYDARGNKVATSTDSFDAQQVYPFEYRDVYDAAQRALFSRGFQMEREDPDNGLILASGMISHMFSGASRTVPFTASVRVRQVGKGPRTEMRMTLDTHWNLFVDSLAVKLEPPSKKLGPELVTEIQKILTTYR